VNKDTGLLATVYTPPDLVDQRVYEILPPEAADWVRDTGLPQPPTAYDTLNAPAPSADAVIADPKPFSYVRGALSIQGTATDANFQRYRLDYGKGLNPDHWQQIDTDHLTSISNGQLAIWDTSALDGLYSLRLTVIRADNSIEQTVIQVTVDNTPPTIQMLQPNNGKTFQMSDEFVTIQPNVNDNVSMSKVEFYVDNQLIATSTLSPYNERWTITAPGTHTIQVRAYDTAGNVATGPLVTITVAP
jgi:Bacterial Ig domain